MRTYLFEGHMKQSIPRAINTMQDNIDRRLLQNEFPERTTRQSNNSTRKRNIKGAKKFVKTEDHLEKEKKEKEAEKNDMRS